MGKRGEEGGEFIGNSRACSRQLGIFSAWGRAGLWRGWPSRWGQTCSSASVHMEYLGVRAARPWKKLSAQVSVLGWKNISVDLENVRARAGWPCLVSRKMRRAEKAWLAVMTASTARELPWLQHLLVGSCG